MPKLEVELKQHTPILQFHDESGAGIRGTELKPALDRFLLRYAHDEASRYEMGRAEGDATDRVHALEYRVKIDDASAEKVPLNAQEERKLRQTGFFAAGLETEGDGNVTHTPMMGEGVTVTFLSAHQGLLNLIAQWIGPFFASTNFGYRKSKGFGCYIVERIGNDVYKTDVLTDIRRVLGGKKVFRINPANLSGNTWLDVLVAIAQVNAVMKSGINLSSQQNTYDRSILMKEYGYAEHTLPSGGRKPSFSNEKRMMKQGITAVNNRSPRYEVVHDGVSVTEMTTCTPQMIQNGEYRFIRALLGFADEYRFGGTSVRAYDVANPQQGAFRMENPLLFKPVRMGRQWQVFVIQREIPREIYNRPFYFSINSANFTPGDGRTIRVCTPRESEFDLEDFLSFVAAYSNPTRVRKDNGELVGLKYTYPLIQEVT